MSATYIQSRYLCFLTLKFSEYIKITKSFPLMAAKAFRSMQTENDQPFNFVYVSGEGATHHPGYFTPIFGRTKGETEIELSKIRADYPQFHASAMRPGFVDVVDDNAIKPFVPKGGPLRAAGLAVLGPAIRAGFKSNWSPTVPLGQFLVEMAAGMRNDDLKGPTVQKLGEFPVVSNTVFRTMMKLDH